MNLELDKIKDAFKDAPAFRMKQAIKAVYEQGAADWGDVSVLSKEMREELNKTCPLDLGAVLDVAEDEKTIKALFNFQDDKVEAVLMRHAGRNTVCVSTQVGCAMACDFCLTGDMGFERNLTMDEMLNQVLYFSRFLKAKGERVTNVVFMGMGEPFNNYDEVMKTVTKLNDKGFFGIGARHISISTSGVVPGIKSLSRVKMQVNLSVSLHAPNNELRDKLMPINKSYPIEVLLKAVKDYILKTRRRVMIEYIMIKGVNDSPKHAGELVKLLQGSLGELFFVNVIKYNDTGKFQSSDKNTMDVFKRIVEQSGVDVVERYRFGQDIKGACGQLATEK